jgi:signal transduction histidine kinase
MTRPNKPSQTSRPAKPPYQQMNSESEALLISQAAIRLMQMPVVWPNDALQWVLMHIGQAVGVERVCLYMPEGNSLVCAAKWQADSNKEVTDGWHERQLTDLPIWQQWQTRPEPVFYTAQNTSNHCPLPGAQACGLIPLAVEQTVVGALVVLSAKEEASWPETAVSFLQTISQLLAAACQKHQQEKRTRLSQKIGRALLAAHQPDPLLTEAITLLTTQLQYSHVHIFLPHPKFFHVPTLPKEPVTFTQVSAAEGDLPAITLATISPEQLPASVAKAFATQEPQWITIEEKRPSATTTHVEAAAPLQHQKQLLGVLFVHVPPEFASFPDEQSRLNHLAEQLAAALHLTRWFTLGNEQFLSAKMQLAQRKKLTQASREILAALDERQLWRAMQRAVKKMLDAPKTAVFLYNAQTKQFTCPFAHGLSTKFITNLNRHFDSLPDGQIIESGQPIIINDVQTDPRIRRLRHEMIYENILSYAVLPLPAPQGVFGAVTVYRKETRPFTPNDIETGITLATIVSIAFQNIRFFQEISQALTRERSLNQMAQTLNSTHDMPTILSSVIRLSSELLDAHSGILGLIIDNQIITYYPYNLPTAIHLRPVPKSQSASWYLIETEKTIRLDQYTQHPRAQYQWVRAGAQAYLGVVIRAGEDILGTLEFFRFNAEAPFSERDQQLANAIALQAGIAIQNARHFAEAEQRATALANALARQEELDNLKNAFIQNVSHELRTPLGLIYGYAELLESSMDKNLDDAQKQAIQIIARRTRMLSHLVEDLSALLAAETQEFRRELLSPIQLLHSVLADYKIQAEEMDIQLKAEIADKVPFIQGDPTHLRRVFDNLLSNAFKYTPAGGQVTLRMWAEGMEVFAEVEDTGPGIAPPHLRRIFERFYQITDGTTPRKKGTGLGLALVKEIIEAHRGHVSVRSTLNKGTTFTISLPGVSLEQAT